MYNRLRKNISILLICIFAFGLVSCNLNNTNNNLDLNTDSNNTNDDFNLNTGLQSFERAAVDFSNIKFTSWDVKSASLGLSSRAEKPYTIMVYMNGSDLESNVGAATSDLIEMLDSGLKSRNANLVVLTGGAKRWLNNVVPSDTCVIWELADGYIYKLADIGLKNMGDPGTLAGFIDFSVNNFPAEKYGLIFWDHGGGSIAGFGSDEKFNNSNLTLLDLNCAFEKSMLKDIKLEFLGFDACLMAAVEMAVVASDYADYLIASEDLEPGDGWDYSFLSVLNTNQLIDGKVLGKAIVDYYFKFYGTKYYGDLTLSVIDLKNVNKVMYSMGELMNVCSENLKQNKTLSFNDLSKKRYATKTFGDASPINNVIDMVDIGDMVEKLGKDYSDEAKQILAALNNCVVYNKHNSDVALSGLSAYYIYGGKNTGARSLGIYSDLKMNNNYTAYLYNFFNALIGKNETRSMNLNHEEKDVIRFDLTIWKNSPQKGNHIMTGVINRVDEKTIEDIISNMLFPKINGNDICMFEISNSNKGQLFSVPISMNGKHSELIILTNKNYPAGIILGVRKEEGFKIQKGYDKIQNGDRICFYYKTKNFNDGYDDSLIEYNRENWYRAPEFTVNEEFYIDWTSAMEENDIFYSIMSTDTQNNKSYSDLKRLQKTQEVA